MPRGINIHSNIKNNLNVTECLETFKNQISRRKFSLILTTTFMFVFLDVPVIKRTNLIFQKMAVF
jgi:hypothetical protein